MIYELRIYRVMNGRMADLMTRSNITPCRLWSAMASCKSGSLDDDRWSLGTTPHLSACMGVACTAPRKSGMRFCQTLNGCHRKSTEENAL